MVFYNPLYWFRKSKEEHVFCSNPNCSLEIIGKTIGYDSVRKRFYHDKICHEESLKREHQEAGNVIPYSNLTFISPRKALRLKRNLTDSKDLEVIAEHS